MQIAEATNHVFSPAHFQQASANFVCAGANFFNDGRKWDSVSAKFVRIDADLILANKPSYRRYFSDARNGFELVAKIPVLKTAQIGQTALMAVIHKNILINPSGARGIWPDHGVNSFRQSSLDLLHVFQDTG